MNTVSDVIGGRWTFKQINEAFAKVSNPKDWKAPIDAWIPASDKSITLEAISFFTAAGVRVEAVKKDLSEVRVVSCGYRLGPAGDH